jgi:hypothetical protein
MRPLVHERVDLCGGGYDKSEWLWSGARLAVVATLCHEEQPQQLGSLAGAPLMISQPTAVAREAVV